MLDLKNNEALLKMREQMVHEVKVEVNDMNNGTKEVKIEVNTNDKILHSNISKDVVIDKINYKERNTTKPIREVRRGDIWYVDLGSDRKGSLQKNIRPWIILSNNISNKYSPNLNGCAITSQLGKTDLPVHVRVQGFGLKKESIILTETIESIDKNSQLLTYIGSVDEEVLNKIDMAIKIQLGDLKPKTPLERLPQEIQDEVNETLQYIYSYEKVLGKSQSDNLNHLLYERSILLEHLESICNEYKIDYKDYYIPYTKERNVAVG